MTLDSMGLLSIIKKLVYARGTNNLKQWWTLWPYLKKVSKTTKSSGTSTCYEKACYKLGLKFGRYEDDAREVLKEKVITELTTS